MQPPIMGKLRGPRGCSVFIGDGVSRGGLKEITRSCGRRVTGNCSGKCQWETDNTAFGKGEAPRWEKFEFHARPLCSIQEQLLLFALLLAVGA